MGWGSRRSRARRPGCSSSTRARPRSTTCGSGEPWPRASTGRRSTTRPTARRTSKRIRRSPYGSQLDPGVEWPAFDAGCGEGSARRPRSEWSSRHDHAHVHRDRRAARGLRRDRAAGGGHRSDRRVRVPGRWGVREHHLRRPRLRGRLLHGAVHGRRRRAVRLLPHQRARQPVRLQQPGGRPHPRRDPHHRRRRRAAAPPGGRREAARRGRTRDPSTSSSTPTSTATTSADYPSQNRPGSASSASPPSTAGPDDRRSSPAPGCACDRTSDPW